MDYGQKRNKKKDHCSPRELVQIDDSPHFWLEDRGDIAPYWSSLMTLILNYSG